MRKAKVNWEIIGSFRIDAMNNYSRLEKILQEIVDGSDSEILDGSGLYAIVVSDDEGDREILYIGETHDQTIKERLPGEHDAYDNIVAYLGNLSSEMYVFAGEIIPISPSKVTDVLIQDIEACLIYNLQPTYNTQNKERCKNPITVKNTGFITDTYLCNEDDCI